MNTRSLVILGLLVCVLLSLPFVAGGSSGYEIVFESDHVEVPEQTVEFEGDEYSITAIGLADPDGAITVTVETDESDDFNLYLYNSDNEIEETEPRMEGGDQATFDVDRLAPGTYMLMVNSGSTEALAPVVIEAYDVSDPEPTGDDDITGGDDVEVTTTLRDLEPAPIDHVELIVVDGNDEERIRMSETDDGTYTATIKDVDEGDYDLYATVHGEDEIQGEKEMIGVSDVSTITVSDPDDGDDDDSDGGAGGGTGGGAGGGADDGDSVDSTETPTSTPTATPDNETTDTPTDTPTETPEETPTDTPTTTPTDTPATTPTDTPTETDDGVITPNQTDGEADDGEREDIGTADTVPLNGVSLFIIAVAALGLVARYRSQSR